jgi:hypothetical protein
MCSYHGLDEADAFCDRCCKDVADGSDEPRKLAQQRSERVKSIPCC